MKALRNDEISEIASELQALVGAQLQEVIQSEAGKFTEFGLGFYHDQRMVWLWFDLEAKRPLILCFDHRPPPRPKTTKPLLLFARAHLVGRRLMGVAMNVELGRVLEFEFHDPAGEPHVLEARLFPFGPNLTIIAGSKRLSLSKPKDAPAKPTPIAGTGEATTQTQVPELRTWDQVKEEWLAEKGLGPKPSATVAPTSKPEESEAERARKVFEKALAKKTQALAKMQQDLEAKSDPAWRLTGEWLKEHGTLDVPPEMRERVDRSKSLSWNIETCFTRAKENERKLEGTRERLNLLERELEDLRAKGPDGYMAEAQAKAKTQQAGKKAASLLEAAGARGRKLLIGEDMEAYIGRSAADNLALLRRAQPHDLWLHLRDYPGSHAILRRAKGRQVTDAELNELGRWVVVQSLHKSEAELKGARFDMILAECRYVRPIKGDKLGRVNYQNDRLFVVRL